VSIPFTYENLIVVSDRAYDNTYRFSIEIVLALLQKTGIAWLKIVQWAGVLQNQSLVHFAILRERESEWLALSGVHAARAWDVLCEQDPTTLHVERLEKTAVMKN
jgi:hypothetical protein